MIRIADEDYGRGRHFLEFNARLFKESYEAVLAEEKPDGVVVCSEFRPPAGETGGRSEESNISSRKTAGDHAGRCGCHAWRVWIAPGGVLNDCVPHALQHTDDRGQEETGGGANTFGKIYACKGTDLGECPKHRIVPGS